MTPDDKDEKTAERAPADQTEPAPQEEKPPVDPTASPNHPPNPGAAAAAPEEVQRRLAEGATPGMAAQPTAPTAPNPGSVGASGPAAPNPPGVHETYTPEQVRAVEEQVEEQNRKEAEAAASSKDEKTE